MKSLIVAVLVALVVSILLTPQLIKVFTRRGLGTRILGGDSGATPDAQGIPTMGGTAIIVAMWTGYVVSIGVQRATGGGGPTASGWLLLFLSTGLGTVGTVDDYLKVRHDRSRGLPLWVKLASRALVAGVFGVLAVRLPNHRGQSPASIHLSYARDLPFLSIGVAGLVIFAIAASAAWSTAVHLTDGLDGLAVGIGGMMLGAYTFISFYQSRKSCFGGHLSDAAFQGCYQVRDPLDCELAR